MNNKALTMLELVLVIALLGFALVGLLISYVSSLNLSEYDKNLTIAMNIAREKMEELYNNRSVNFDNLGENMGATHFAGNYAIGKEFSFDNAYMKSTYDNFNGSCTIYITSLDQNLKEARIVVCWKQQVGRITGEDKNLNGYFDEGDGEGEYTNQLDSPCRLVSAFTKR
jgi:type II secretory pathway pseudopilin PulG